MEVPMDPVIAQKSPYGVNEEPGTRWWCACGRSENQPYCDGSHKGTGIAPVRVDLAQQGEVWYCGCKRTGTRPWCDGTHNQL
jgi:CDGSH-type Zn-finger protein